MKKITGGILFSLLLVIILVLPVSAQQGSAGRDP
jgi:hypothetical protein